MRTGRICYLDEIVEARKDTTVVIHPLTDHRRILPIEKTGEMLEAHPDFLLVISYNPGYQSVLEGPEASRPASASSASSSTTRAATWRRRSSPTRAASTAELAGRLAEIGWRVRELREHGFEEGAWHPAARVRGTLIARA